MWTTRREAYDSSPPAYEADKTWETPVDVYEYLADQSPAKSGRAGRIEVVAPDGETMTRREFFQRHMEGGF